MSLFSCKHISHVHPHVSCSPSLCDFTSVFSCFQERKTYFGIVCFRLKKIFNEKKQCIILTTKYSDTIYSYSKCFKQINYGLRVPLNTKIIKTNFC